MTKVGFVGPMPPIRGGIAAHSAGLVAGIESLGHATTVVSWQKQYPSLLYRRPERDESTPASNDVSWMLRWWDPFSWRAAGRALAGVDQIVAPWTVALHAPHYRSIFAGADVAYVLVVHNAHPHEAMWGSSFAARRLFAGASRLVVHAESVAEECRALAPGIPISVVGMPALLPVVQRSLPTGSPRLLLPGYLRDYKGTDVALDAMRVLRERGIDAHLTVAGEPWDGDTERWTRLVDDLGIGDRVTLDLRYLPDAELCEMIADHHLTLAPYRSATQSGIVPQALAAGRPVVATRVGGLPDLVVDGANGALANPGNARDLARAIERCLSDLESSAARASEGSRSFADVARAVLGASPAMQRLS